MGHALVAMSLRTADPVHKVSIVSRGLGALGYTMQRPTEDRFLMSYDEIEDKMKVMLGGRASEMLIFGKPSTGAADDLQKATELARASVTRYGMSPTLGLAVYEQSSQRFLGESGTQHSSEQTTHEIDCAIRAMIQKAFESATHLLQQQRDVLERGAQMLLAKETLVEAELATLRPAPTVARQAFAE